jgi:hypothetical protein
MRKKFTSYKSFADATMTDIFSGSELNAAGKLYATCLATSYFENRDGTFIEHVLPVQAQFSPVYRIMVHDINNDGFKDMLLLGNNESPRLKIGKADANFGTLLLNDKHGNFTYSANMNNGLFVAGDVRDAEVVRIKDSNYLLVAVNNSDLLTIKLEQ